MSSLVHINEHDAYTSLHMDDGKANALGFDMIAAINAGLDVAEARGMPVVIEGRPGKFSAGFDLTVMVNQDAETQRLLSQGAELSLRLMRFKTPVILAVTGHALAMGALLCLSADYRIGTQGEFKIGLNEAAIGMTLPWFGVELARHRLASTHFTASVALAKIFNPESAIESGFLDEAVDASALSARVAEMAETFGKLDMAAHRGSKERVREEFFARSEEGLKRDFAAA